MKNDSLSKPTVSFGVALAVGSVANALLVIAKEKSPAVQSLMKRMTGHHWVTHVAVIVAIYVISRFLFTPAISTSRLIKTIIASVLVSGLAIVGFYLLAD
ncbi:MAG TPA: hypothetical protein VGO57_13320 [Verrucomicrobiae bacterium]|jgi:uncharacterized membrane protein YdcZ (DUF606 family)